MFNFKSTVVNSPNIVSLPNSDKVKSHILEKEEVIIISPLNKSCKKDRRFADFFDVISESKMEIGTEEPLEIKAIRPFLMSGEFTSVSSNKNGKGKKGKKIKSTMAKVFLLGGAFPNMGRTLKDNSVYRVQKNFENTLLTLSATLPTFAAQYFTLSQSPDYTSLVNVFDQYRISEVEAWIAPAINYNGTPGNQVPYYTVIDYDDANTPASLVELQEFANCQSSMTDNGHYHHFTPHAAVAAYSGAFTSYANETAPWIDCGSPSVQHFGLKIAASVIGSGGGVFSVFGFYRLTLEFRNSR